MKHDHKKTKKLKIALFSMVMFLPFIAIGVTCATHIFNKEVTEETETATINYMYELGNIQEPIQNNKLYKLNATQSNETIYINNIEFITDNTTTIKNEINPISIITYDNNIYIYSTELEDWQPLNAQNTYIVYYDNQYEQDSYTLLENGNNYYNPIINVTITTNPQDQTTNIFYDSCAQVEQSFILNWCEQANPVRGPIQSFTTAFILPNEHIINTLITYWICIAMIYIVIDIIIECVIMITHFFNKEF